jgi:hypothetical protein
MPATNRYAGKSPTDLTGRRGAQLQKEEDERKAREQAELAAKGQGKDVELDDKGIHPETGRHGGGDDPDATERVRVSYPIEQMTFGKVIADPGEQNETGAYTRLPVLGPLKMYSFKEGVEYRMTPEMAGHLRQQGYLYSFE